MNETICFDDKRSAVVSGKRRADFAIGRADQVGFVLIGIVAESSRPRGASIDIHPQRSLSTRVPGGPLPQLEGSTAELRELLALV